MYSNVISHASFVRIQAQIICSLMHVFLTDFSDALTCLSGTLRAACDVFVYGHLSIVESDLLFVRVCQHVSEGCSWKQSVVTNLDRLD